MTGMYTLYLIVTRSVFFSSERENMVGERRRGEFVGCEDIVLGDVADVDEVEAVFVVACWEVGRLMWIPPTVKRTVRKFLILTSRYGILSCHRCYENVEGTNTTR
jgi:hypothetical protein